MDATERPEVALRHLAADILGLSDTAKRVLAARGGDADATVEQLARALPRRAADIDPDARREGATPTWSFLEPEELVEALEERYAAAPVPVELHAAQRRNLERLRDPSARVVVCGQQPGFLGGPLFNTYKALHAAALAAHLEQTWRRPVVPVFWVHSDDHDLAEVNHAHLLNRNLDLARIGLPGMGSGRTPICELPLDAERHRLEALRANLLHVLPATERREALLDASFPRDGETLGEAFVRGGCATLGATGILFLEPQAIRGPVSRALAELLRRPLPDALRTSCATLERVGIAHAIEHDQVPWVFEHDQRGRVAQRWRDGGFQRDDEPGQRSPTELAARVVQEPERWSSGFLTRPLAQDLCLPTVAYVGGWGELEYHLPLLLVRDALQLPRPAFVPRLSATLSSPSARTSLERLGLEPEEFLRSRGVVVDRDGRESAAAADIRAEATDAAKRMRGLSSSLEELDRSLAAQLRRAARQSQALFEKLARKAERVDANRRGKARRHVRRLRNTWWGNDQHQERVLTGLQYRIAFGDDWCRALASDLDPFALEHVLLEISEEPEPLDGTSAGRSRPERDAGPDASTGGSDETS